MNKRITGVLVVLLIMFSQSSVVAQTDGIPTELEIEIHRLINDVRADKEMHNQDLLPLKLHSVLIDVARAHSRDMLENDYFAHTNLDGLEPADRVSNAGVEYSSVGENLFYASGISEGEIAEEAVNGWVESPGHYANIITGYSFTGLGVAQSGSLYYITQVFVTADPAHLENIGQIFENEDLDDIQEDDNSFEITAQTASLLFVAFLIGLGIIAGRRNDRYYGRRR